MAYLATIFGTSYFISILEGRRTDGGRSQPLTQGTPIIRPGQGSESSVVTGRPETPGNTWRCSGEIDWEFFVEMVWGKVRAGAGELEGLLVARKSCREHRLVLVSPDPEVVNKFSTWTSKVCCWKRGILSADFHPEISLCFSPDSCRISGRNASPAWYLLATNSDQFLKETPCFTCENLKAYSLMYDVLQENYLVRLLSTGFSRR